MAETLQQQSQEFTQQVAFEEKEYEISFKLQEVNKLSIEFFNKLETKKKWKNEFLFFPENEQTQSNNNSDIQIIQSNAFDTMQELFEFIVKEVFQNNLYKIQLQDESTLSFNIMVNYKEINFVLTLEDDNQSKLLKTLSKYKARLISLEQQNNEFVSQYIQQNIKISNLEFQNQQLTEQLTEVKEKYTQRDLEIQNIQVSISQLNLEIQHLQSQLIQSQQQQSQIIQIQPQQQQQQQQPQQIIQISEGELNMEELYKQMKQIKQKYKEQEPVLKEQAVQKLFNESNILKSRTKFQKLFETWMPKKLRNVNLIFRSLVNGITAQAFHEKCDNKGPTLVIILTKQGYVFGGFSSESWQKTGEYVASKDNFIFSLEKQDKLTIIDNDQIANAQLNDKLNGPRFGAGCDLGIFGNEQNLGWTNLGKTYKSEKIKQVDDNSKKYLAGAQQFVMSEWEVFQVEY